MPEDNEHHHDEGMTNSTRERWEWIGTILAALIITSAVFAVIGTMAGILSMAAVTQAWFLLYLTLVLMAATWTFGKGTLEAVKEYKK